MTKINYPETEVLWFRHFAKINMRSFFDGQGFIELDTPYLITANTPDPYIDPVLTNILGANGKPKQLHTSPEIWLKRALILGFDKIYHLARVFRDDPEGDHHSTEFTMLEWYRTNAILTDLLVDCDAIFRLCLEIGLERQLTSALCRPIERVDLDFLFREFAKVDLPNVLAKIEQGELDCLQVSLSKNNSEFLPRNASFADAFFHVMLKYIEPNLPYDQPIAIFRWPIQLAALAAPCPDDAKYCDRFEIYFKGLEIANAYQECSDAQVLRARFIKENEKRAQLNKPVFPIDEELLETVGNLKNTAGIALGVDRLFMALLEKKQISEIIFGQSDH